ncbi:DUF2726 domain-containing protein [Vibrio coralliilyticus]|uniref:DUF2726 domain-containing protein n=1 Tax=Vibrio coralliilyticus TaxID=190893 RepID=UPI00068EC44F|nr:DUF2726 domain-containing protein [Vibrio coralliilyticus]NOH36747.1 DUF2726 domain-containing protein [Vibrio coralliilyticus]
MNFDIPTIAICAVAIIAIFIMFGSGKSGASTLPYIPKDRLLSNAELSFYQVLNSILRDNVTAFSKVRIADIVGIKKGLDRKNRMSHLGKIAQKHVDFVITDAKTSKIIAAIELDDSSHKSERGQKRDMFVNNVFASANIPLVRFPAQRGYQLPDLMSQLEHLDITKLQPNVIDKGQSIETAATPELERPKVKEGSHQAHAKEMVVEQECPKCGGMLIERQGSNKRSGKFYGCSNFPKCRHTQNI